MTDATDTNTDTRTDTQLSDARAAERAEVLEKARRA